MSIGECCECGAQQEMTCIHCDKQSGWISVEDRLPEAKQVVLFYWKCADGSGHCYGEYCDDDEVWKDFLDTDRDGYANVVYTSEISHWMPLPSPPEAGEE